MPFPPTPSQTASNTPTPSITSSLTPSLTPTLTQCPGICFSGVGANNYVDTILQDVFDPSKIMVLGMFTSFNGVARTTMVRSFTDGQVDTSFNPGNGFTPIGVGNTVEFAQQPDGKYVVVGNYTQYSGVSRNRIARINYDGTLDTSFIVGTGSTRQLFYALVQSDGKILVCGTGNNFYSGTSVGVLFRLNTDGSLDGTFSNNEIPGSGTLASKVYINPDGTLYLCGNFTHLGRRGIVKLNANGTYAAADPFNTSGVGVNNNVADFQVQPDGKLIIVGDFSTYNGGVATLRDIRRINANGTEDATFNGAGTGSNNYIFEVELQGSKYIISGFFTSWNGTPVNQVIRLNNNGSLDTSWNDGVFEPVPNDLIQHIYMITGNTIDNGYIFIGGDFQSYDGVLASNIIKVDSNGFAVDCDPILITPTVTASPTITPTITMTPTNTSTIPLTPSMTPTSTIDCPYTIYTHGAVRATCSDYCNDNYLIQTTNCATQNYAGLTIGDFIYGYAGQSGYIAYSNISTDTNTGPFLIADIDGTGEILGIYICSGGSCIPL